MREQTVSIVIPIYNSARLLPAALASIRRQSYPHWEIWLVDDGSSDHIKDVVGDYEGELRYLWQEHRGPAAARNLALQQVNGDIVAFLDADDVWAEDHLSNSMASLQTDPELGIVSGAIRNWRWTEDRKASYCSPAYHFGLLPCSVFRRSVFDQVGLLDESLMYGEDSDFFLRCWEKRVRKTRREEVTYLYRRHKSNMTEGKDLRELGLVQLYARRLKRIRQGLFQPDSSAAQPLQEYLGHGPEKYDDGRDEPVGDEILACLGMALQRGAGEWSPS